MGLSAIGRINKLEVFAVGALGRVFYSSDAGAHWIEQLTPTKVQLGRVAFVNDSVGLIAGEEGVILRTSNRGKSWVQVYPEHIPITSQSYPEPFSRSATIRFSLPSAAKVDLNLFFPDGKVARELLLNAALPLGTHEITVDARGLASGVYIYRIDADGLMATGRITLVK